MQFVKAFKFIGGNKFDGLQSNRAGERLGEGAFGYVEGLQAFRE